MILHKVYTLLSFPFLGNYDELNFGKIAEVYTYGHITNKIKPTPRAAHFNGSSVRKFLSGG
jgi:hypothetical protein